MRNNTAKIYERLIRGSFLAVDSTDPETRTLYNAVEENLDDYQAYFNEIGFKIEGGEGYFYLSREREAKQSVEQKLQSLASWIDILDFLKTFDITFSTGFQFRASQFLERINVDVELRDKSGKLFENLKNNRDIVEKLVKSLSEKGFIECISEKDETYKVTSAFRYIEDLISIINIYNEEDIPET